MARASIIPGRPLTQGALNTVEASVGALIDAYHAASDALSDELARLTMLLAGDEDSTLRYRRDQVASILSDVARRRAELDADAFSFATESLSRIYTVAGEATARAVTAAGGYGSAAFGLVDQQALEILASDTFSDLAAATSYMDESARRVIREATKARVQLSAATGTGVPADARALARTLRERGVAAFVDAAGHEWSLGSYTEMVVRTKSAHAFNTSVALATERSGTRAMEIVDGERSRHDECLAFNRRTCSPAWALANPIQHPNAVAPGTRVVPVGRVLAVYRIPWSGPVVHVRSARAGWLTIGPYHPVLTRRGWVPGHDLEPGDQLVRSTGERADVLRGHDLEDVPARIEDVFDAARNVGVVSRVVAAVDQFHGDGRFAHGEVEVVELDCLLPDVGHVPLIEERGERRLDAQRPAVESAFLTGERALALDLRAVTLTAPRSVSLLDVRRVVPSPAQRQATLAETVADHRVGAAEVVRDLSRRLAIDVALDDVLEVKFESMSGHLYDLSTAGGTYLADARLVSNCVRGFGPLPLHAGPVDFGTVGTAAEQVARAHAAADLPDDLVFAVQPPG